MTLDTRIMVLDPIDHKTLFAKMNSLLGADEGTEFRDEDGTINNLPMQGLPGWLFVYYGSDDAPYLAPGAHHEYCHEEDNEEPCDSTGFCTPAWAVISIDTAYGYRGENGESCSDLHASLIAKLGLWLDEKGIAWKWQNEFTGEVYDRYDGLETLVQGGIEATDWFNSIVKPAIERGLLP